MSEEFRYIPYDPYDDNIRGLIRNGHIYNLKDVQSPDAGKYRMGLSGILLRQDEDETDAMLRDVEFMKEMYPDKLRAVSRVVEDECDRLEYEGSPMLMEYPDREELRRVARRVYSELEKQKMSEGDIGDETAAHDMLRHDGRQDCVLRNIIEVLICNEFCVRRDRHRRRRRRFY